MGRNDSTEQAVEAYVRDGCPNDDMTPYLKAADEAEGAE